MECFQQKILNEGTNSCFYSSHYLFLTVLRLDGSVPVKYGLRLNMDEKYKALKKELSSLADIPPEQILLVEIVGPVVKVTDIQFCRL